MLTKEEINNQKERFNRLAAEINREGAAQLLSWLNSSDFFSAPASTRFHSSFEGGLCRHSLFVYDRLIKRLDEIRAYYPNVSDKELNEKLAVSALLHDVCKVDFYKTDYKNQKVYKSSGSKYDSNGNFDWETVEFYTIDEKLPFGHGEKSVYIIQSFMQLKRDEAAAILAHMGDFSDQKTSKIFDMFPLAVFLHIADLEASHLDEMNGNT